ncbi:MAG TPA: methyltransferase domain-containing protein [Candidatus Caenarcaniphilales bacterium]
MSSNWKKDYPSIQNLTEGGLDENNSLKKMLHLVGDDKQVVDFGCATGYLSQLLVQKGCKVTGVEINPDAARIAEQYCNQVIVADLDLVSLSELLPGQSFDVAVFGDVLEHLRDPWRVLAETRQLLKPEGYVVASIPNIAHGAICLALVQGRFEYTELGILDNTHLRFFTRKTVEELFNDSGYFLDCIDRTKLPIFSDSPLIPQVNKHDFNSQTVQQIEQETESETLQFILRAYPLTLEAKFTALDQRYTKLAEHYEQAQSQLQLNQTQLLRSEEQLQQAHRELGQSQEQLQHTQGELARSQEQLQRTQVELEQAKATIHGIQCSRLWKLRTQLLNLRNHRS